MRTLLFVPAMVLLLLLSGCIDLLSVNPLATAETAVFDAGLTGEWLCADQVCDGMAVIIRAGSTENKDYDTLWNPWGADLEVLHLKGQLVQVGDRLVFDLVAARQTDLAVPAHFFMLVDKTADGVRFSFLDSDWLQSQVISQYALAHAMVDGKPVITAGSEEISAFLARFGLDPRAVSHSLWLKPVKGQ